MGAEFVNDLDHQSTAYKYSHDIDSSKSLEILNSNKMPDKFSTQL